MPGGWLFVNIPAFGHDDVFGEVFPVYVAQWEHDIAADRPFRVLHCDDDGYPVNGHLIWAHTTWWVAQFEAAGFVRQPDVSANSTSATPTISGPRPPAARSTCSAPTAATGEARRIRVDGARSRNG